MKMLISLHRFVLVCAGIAFFLWTFNSHVPFTGVAEMEYVGGKLHGRITRLHPLDRVRLTLNQDGRTIAENLIEDPVYFEVKSAVDFREVNFEILYQNRSGAPLGIGIRRGSGYKSFDIAPLKPVGSQGVWTVGEATLDLTGVQRERSRYRFILSFPGVEYARPQNGDILISKFSARLHREPLTVKDFARFTRFITGG